MADHKINKFKYGNETYLFQDSTIVLDRKVTTGVNIFDITIGDSKTEIYAPSSGGSGTVTSVGVSNATNGGLTISGSPITSSGSITVGHSNVLTSAQTTQAVYPIKIDKNGHISAYGSAVTITDEKLKVAEVTKGDTLYYPIVGTGTTASTRQYDTTGFVYERTSGTIGDESLEPKARLTLGNNTNYTVSGSSYGIVRLYGTRTNYTDLVSGTPTATRTITLPDNSGTVALISDIPIVPTAIESNTTGISISDHSTTTIYGVKSGTNSTTTASKVTVGSSSTDYGVTAAGSGSFTQGTFSGGSFSATVTNHVLSYSFTAATHGADSHTHTAPTLGSKVPTVSASDVTVPIRADSSTTVVTSKAHTISDSGHTHLFTNGQLS